MSSHLREFAHQHLHRPSAAGISSERQKKYYADCLDSNLEGFIHHPADFPLSWRRIKKLKHEAVETEHGNLGLCFVSDKYIRPGTILELNITLRGETHCFVGQVILVRNRVDQFEIGVWFSSREDAGRVRIVEQICHIESYLRSKRHYDGPFISKERVAQEWITRFASRFPSFG